MKAENNTYYVGLDIGTDSVGYAATKPDYTLIKFKGEPVWGTHLFETAKLCDERRGFRTARRRLDRRQQRVRLIQEVFAPEISRLDPDFFHRIYESRLLSDDRSYGENEFMKRYFGTRDNQYPTIHHLICDLMESDRTHDVRLVYLACAWLVAHRGHFLSEVSKENIKDLLDIGTVYHALICFFEGELPWDGDIDINKFAEILGRQSGVNAKYKELSELLYGKNKASRETTETFPYSREGVLKLLCGGSYSVADLFGKAEYSELKSVSLKMKDEDLAGLLAALDDDAELIVRLKAIFDCVMLKDIMKGQAYISVSKKEVYEIHKKDLKDLKAFIHKYAPNKYSEVFRESKPGNYVAYSGNYKSVSGNLAAKDKNIKEAFRKYLLSVVKNITPDESDARFFEDMKQRLSPDLCTFLPKQVDGDNRLIPYQLYYTELVRVLEKASAYLPFLTENDSEGYTKKDKIISVFEFRVPYFVGPLNRSSNYAWLERKAEGRITPWNFADKVDLDRSEQHFIDRMTNTCTYLPGETVLPKASLCYQRYMVLNEINNLNLNGISIPVDLKQHIFENLFMKQKRVSPKSVKGYLVANGICSKEDAETLSGVDDTIKSSLSSYLSFMRFFESGKLTETEAERIIELAAYIESRRRLMSAIKKEFPRLSETDICYICSLNLKGFGRLSRALLAELPCAEKSTGEANTVLEWLWQTNNNLMMLMSDKFTFAEQIAEIQRDYYSINPKKLTDRLDEMYVSNAVKRPIIRTFDILSDIIRANCGKVPTKLFIEMARGTVKDERGKRTKSRNKQLRELYNELQDEEVPHLFEQLDALGDETDNRLQSDSLFLYFMQLGKCMYTGQELDIDRLKEGVYNIEHIYPKSKVKDDSIINNKVLVLSSVNGEKNDTFPINSEIRQKMFGWWKHLHEKGLIGDETFKRLTRSTPFSDDEKWGFINRQLVETRQSTKAVAALLKEKYPETEIVYVKAGLVSDFRQEFEMLKSRAVNDLHHAKDAYLNIVVGNVYHERFTRQWFLKNIDSYNVNIDTLFGHPVSVNGKEIWKGGSDIATVRKTISKHNIHFTQYAFCRKGGFFDQMPKKAADGLVPLKNDLPTEKYGGYNKSTASFYMLAGFTLKQKREIMLVPVELLHCDRVPSDDNFTESYIKSQIEDITGNKIEAVDFPIGMRKIKINTVFELDGFRVCLAGKDSGGTKVLLIPIMPLALSPNEELYIKHLESFAEKLKKNPNLHISEKHTKITTEQNCLLYDVLTKKLKSSWCSKRPSISTVSLDREKVQFEGLDVKTQSLCLLQIISLFGRRAEKSPYINIGSGSCTLSAKLSNWKYTDVRIIDTSASGLFEKRSANLKTLL